jgi:hypothetical protein
MTYLITVTAVGPRGGKRRPDSYEIADEDFDRPDWAFKDLIRVMALRSAMGKSAWPLPTDDEREA